MVPMQPWVQRKILYITEWKSIRWGISVGECSYIVNQSTTLRMVVIREKIRVNDKTRKQLRLLNIEDVRFNYQVIVTNSDKTPQKV